MVKQELPFQSRDFTGEALAPRAVASDRLAQIDEAKGVPRRLGGEKLGRSIELRLSRQLASRTGQWLKDGMLAHAAKPVFRIAIVRLAAVHDAVPVTAVDRVNF